MSPPPIEFCCLLLIVPPRLRNAAGKSGLLRRRPEYVPIGDAMRRQIPMRYPVTPGAYHPIECTARDRQLAARLGLQDFLNQRVNHRIRNAGEIERAVHLRGLGTKIGAERVAGRRREIESLHGDIEVEFVGPLAELHRIDHPQCRVDAKGAEILDEWHVVRLEGRLIDQKLDRDQIAFGIDALAVLDRVAGLLQQVRRLAEQRAVLPRAVGDRWQKGLAEYLVRNLAAKRRE